MYKGVFSITAVLLLLFTTVAHCGGTLSIADFESSGFYEKSSLVRKNIWPLRSGGKNFSYSYEDPENSHSSISVELSSNPSNIKKIVISWSGRSTRRAPRVTKVKERFLRDLLAVVAPAIDFNNAIAYAKSQEAKTYDIGGDAMPRKRFGKAALYAGIVGGTLIVGIDR
jgi:hypothetical protein